MRAARRPLRTGRPSVATSTVGRRRDAMSERGTDRRMTARQQVRLGDARRPRASGRSTPAAPRPSASMLQTARERKGVDLYRAERDTKIRAAPPGCARGRRLRRAAARRSTPRASCATTRSTSASSPRRCWRAGGARSTSGQADTPSHRAATAAASPPRRAAASRSRRGLSWLSCWRLVVLAFAGYVGLQLVRFSQDRRSP